MKTETKSSDDLEITIDKSLSDVAVFNIHQNTLRLPPKMEISPDSEPIIAEMIWKRAEKIAEAARKN